MKRVLCCYNAVEKEGECWERDGERSGERLWERERVIEGTGVWVSHQSRRWEGRGGIEREEHGGRERQSDRELFDEFIRVRSWVAWSQGLTVAEKAERSILIDTLALWMEDPSLACPRGSTPCLKSLTKAPNWFVFWPYVRPLFFFLIKRVNT